MEGLIDALVSAAWESASLGGPKHEVELPWGRWIVSYRENHYDGQYDPTCTYDFQFVLPGGTKWNDAHVVDGVTPLEQAVEEMVSDWWQTLCTVENKLCLSTKVTKLQPRRL